MCPVTRTTLIGPGLCQIRMLLPRAIEDSGLRRTCPPPACGDYREGTGIYLLIPFDFTSQFEFAQRLQSLPTNILPASLSPLSVHRSQFEATLANSPPPG